MKNDVASRVLRLLRTKKLSVVIPSGVHSTRHVCDVAYKCMEGTSYRIAGDVLGVWGKEGKQLRVRIIGQTIPTKLIPNKGAWCLQGDRYFLQDLGVTWKKTVFMMRKPNNGAWVESSKKKWEEALGKLEA